MTNFRTMVPADIPAGLALCRAAGWNQQARDWELFLSLSPDQCSVAVDAEQSIVGTATTLRYQKNFSWIGMLLVHPSSQRHGIGTALLSRCLDILKDEQTVKLDATPAGRAVYLKMGFVDEYEISRMQSTRARGVKHQDVRSRPITVDDLDELEQIDRKIFGADRRKVLDWMLAGAGPYAHTIVHDGKISGYCFGRSGHHFEQVGPIVAVDLKDAIALASAALANCGEGPVVIDALHHTPGWLQWLSENGFSEQRRLTRMYKGFNSSPGIPKGQFAILGPEFG